MPRRLDIEDEEDSQLRQLRAVVAVLDAVDFRPSTTVPDKPNDGDVEDENDSQSTEPHLLDAAGLVVVKFGWMVYSRTGKMLCVWQRMED